MTTSLELIVELLAHMDAGDRRLWTADQDTRPLTDLGRQQAVRMAEALAVEPIDALYSSPALRCRQTLAPLAERFGLSITVLAELRETHGFGPPPGWDSLPGSMADPLGGAYVAGRARAALERIRTSSPGGRVVVCSHGDVVPALIAYLIGAHGLILPPTHDRRGGWYTIRLEGEHISVRHHDPLPKFPTS